MMTLKDLKCRVGYNVGKSKSGHTRTSIPDAECVQIADEWRRTHKATLTKLKRIALDAVKADDPGKALREGIKADAKLAAQLEDMDGQNLYEDLTDPDFSRGRLDVQRAYLKVLAQLA